jgi:hypothetical protein
MLAAGCWLPRLLAAGCQCWLSLLAAIAGCAASQCWLPVSAGCQSMLAANQCCSLHLLLATLHCLASGSVAAKTGQPV